MKKSKNDKQFTDDQLVDFTDHILSEKKMTEDRISFTTDPELHALEQTALRLKNAFHDDGPSEAVIQRMRKNIAVQSQQQGIKESVPFWKKWILSSQKWQSQRTRQNYRMAISLVILFALMVVSAPHLNRIVFNQPATGGQNLNPSILLVSVALILLAFWLIRRKR